MVQYHNRLPQQKISEVMILEKDKVVRPSVDKEIHGRIKKMANDNHRTANGLISLILECWLDKNEGKPEKKWRL